MEDLSHLLALAGEEYEEDGRRPAEGHGGAADQDQRPAHLWRSSDINFRASLTMGRSAAAASATRGQRPLRSAATTALKIGVFCPTTINKGRC